MKWEKIEPDDPRMICLEQDLYLVKDFDSNHQAWLYNPDGLKECVVIYHNRTYEAGSLYYWIVLTVNASFWNFDSAACPDLEEARDIGEQMYARFRK